MSILICGVCTIPIDSKDEKPLTQNNELQGTYDDLGSLLNDHLYESPKRFYFDDGLDESFLDNLAVANDEDEEELSDNEHIMSKKSAAPRRIFIGIYTIHFISFHTAIQYLFYLLILRKTILQESIIESEKKPNSANFHR